jgi:hypothetical protein
MKTKILKLIAVLTVLATGFACEDMSYQKTILGTWREIAYGTYEKYMTPIPDEYLELRDCLVFFPDGTIKYYNPARNEYFIGYFQTYKIEKKFLYLNYERDYDQGRFDYIYEFINENQLQLTIFRSGLNMIGTAPRVFIYQRIN